MKHDGAEMCCKPIDSLPIAQPIILRNQYNALQSILPLRLFHNRSLNAITNLMEITYVVNKQGHVFVVSGMYLLLLPIPITISHNSI